MTEDTIDLDLICRVLKAVPSFGRVERRGDCVAVLVGVLPVFVSPDPDGRRVAVWTTVAEVTETGRPAVARASNAYSEAHYRETGLAMVLSARQDTVLLGRSLDAHGLAAASIVAALREVEKHRRVAEAYLSEIGLRPEEDGSAPADLEEGAVRA